MIELASLDRCFHGIIPGVIATSDREGTPNVSYISQVHLVDARHVALSCQFFNKTRQNLDENPRATVELYDPLTFEAYRMRLTFLRSETSGALYEGMSLRIAAIASHSGMKGIFKLRSADVFEVASIEKKTGYISVPKEEPPDHRALPMGPLTELRGLQLVSERVMRARDLESLMTSSLEALDEVFGFSHGMIFMPAPGEARLAVVASHGYDDAPNDEVRIGEGMVGAVADAQRLLRVSSVHSDLRYGRAIRHEYEEKTDAAGLGDEVPLPGLLDAKSHMAIPLMVEGRLIGVLALECRDSLTFAEWHETFLQVLANQIASGIDRLTQRRDSATPSRHEVAPAPQGERARRTFTYYKNDDCVFCDGEYLIRNVPAKILRRILRAHASEQRSEFTNRELRLDPTLGLPAVKDNLESRLILLRKRLEQKCPDVRIASTGRGRFALVVDCDIEFVDRDST